VRQTNRKFTPNLLASLVVMDDVEKVTEASPSPSPPVYDETASAERGAIGRFLDTFRRDPSQHATPVGAVGANGKVFNAEAAAGNTANSPLARRLKGRHLQMIAIGGSIGAPLPQDKEDG